jgi:hypothetical protein
MGTFLMMSGIANAAKGEVEDALRNLALKRLVAAPSPTGEENESNLVTESDQGNVTVLYQDEWIDWDDASQQLSETLQKPVFSLHIHDGDLWMYILYANGQEVDRFNPIPDYWKELSEADRTSWSGNAAVVSRYWPNVSQEQIANYLVRWNVDNEDEIGTKASPEDEFGAGEDWQIVDFMAKVGLAYPEPGQGQMVEQRQPEAIEAPQPVWKRWRGKTRHKIRRKG